MAAKKAGKRRASAAKTGGGRVERKSRNGNRFHDWEALERDFLEDPSGNLTAWADRQGISRGTVRKRAAKAGWKAKWEAAQAKALEIAASAAVETKAQRIADAIDRDISDGTEMRDAIMKNFRTALEARAKKELSMPAAELDAFAKARQRCQAMVRLALGLTTDAKGHRLQDSNGEDAPLDRLEVTVTPARDTSHLVPP